MDIQLRRKAILQNCNYSVLFIEYMLAFYTYNKISLIDYYNKDSIQP